jgi:hypothetical protein
MFYEGGIAMQAKCMVLKKKRAWLKGRTPYFVAIKAMQVPDKGGRTKSR